MAISRSAIPTIPNGFKGDQRTFAEVVYAALVQAGYRQVNFLGGPDTGGLSIGLSGNTIAVGRLDQTPFRFSDAQACVTTLNAAFAKATGGKVNNLANPRTGRTSIGNVPYAEAVVRCPNGRTLRALSRSFVQG